MGHSRCLVIITKLIKSNYEKERAIEKLEVDFNEFVKDCGREKQDKNNENEEYVELQEKETNTDKKKEIKHPVYVQNALEFAKNAYDDIQWGKEAKLIVKELSKNLSDEPFVFGQTRSKVYQQDKKSTRSDKLIPTSWILDVSG